MIVVDFDAIRGKRMAGLAVRQMVLKNLTKIKSKGEYLLIPVRPIYWLTRHPMNLNDLEAEGFPKIGTLWYVASVVEALREMVKQTDLAAMKLGMKPEGRFRAPVYVVTDKDFQDIQRLGATPRPVQIFGDN